MIPFLGMYKVYELIVSAYTVIQFWTYFLLDLSDIIIVLIP